MQWFRHYHGLCTDPKLHKISRRLKVPRYLIVAAWCAVLEFASDKPDGNRGSIEGLDATEFAFMVGCSEGVADKVLAAFFDAGMLTENRVFNFAKRNFKSDSSNFRVHEFRNRQKLKETTTGCNVSETPQNRTEQIRKENISPSVSLPLIPDEPEAEALDAPAKPSPKRKHQLPDDFDLTPEMIAAAERHGINGAVRDVFEHFCAHHRSKGTTMLRWDLAWITWLKNQKRFGHGPPLYKQRKSKAEECAELMEMWRLEDERKNEGSFETEFNGLPSNVSILRSKA